jgi:ubiquinone/menaquinone biosynthesis C-methylase UbiE
MTHTEALAFLTAAGPFHGTWVDVGAGTGTFSLALAELLGPTGNVIAIDTNERALRQLSTNAGRTGATHAPVSTVHTDMHDLSAIADLAAGSIDGFLFANVLHFTPTPDTVLTQAAKLLKPDGRILVVEYDRRQANPWVPHPLPLGRLAEVARYAGLTAPREIARRPSAYHREMYLAVLQRRDNA